MNMRWITGAADGVRVKLTPKPLPFNPLLAMAVKGMWSTTFTQAIVEAIEQDDLKTTTESEPT
jgi:hypothetical protein